MMFHDFEFTVALLFIKTQAQSQMDFDHVPILEIWKHRPRGFPRIYYNSMEHQQVPKSQYTPSSTSHLTMHHKKWMLATVGLVEVKLGWHGIPF
jgi:hypothetical protein